MISVRCRCIRLDLILQSRTNQDGGKRQSLIRNDQRKLSHVQKCQTVYSQSDHFGEVNAKPSSIHPFSFPLVRAGLGKRQGSIRTGCQSIVRQYRDTGPCLRIF
ncbi:hypothetical protein AMECASPLE_033122 [Ameca splendens]|uniref:Uncharacterized protein n=1 Tax=Ameca splendens TaxID=208324 RepID=A0ABV1AF99_9TELE